MKKLVLVFFLFFGFLNSVFGADGVCSVDYKGQNLFSLPSDSNLLCSSGTLSNLNLNSGGWTWDCFKTSPIDDDDLNCQANKKVNGVCSTAFHNQIKSSLYSGSESFCESGEFSYGSPFFNPTTFKWYWTCNGLNGGTDASCYSFKSESGVCGNQIDSCLGGKFKSLQDNFTHNLWVCEGVHGGTTSGICSVERDDDLDGITNTFDLCPRERGTNLNFQGCLYEYSLKPGTQCEKSDDVDRKKIDFKEGNLICNYDDWASKKNYFHFKGDDGTKNDDVSSNRENLVYKPDRGSGKYTCYNEENFGNDLNVGNCELRHNANQFCQNDFLTLAKGDKKVMYVYKNILPFENHDLTVKGKNSISGKASYINSEIFKKEVECKDFGSGNVEFTTGFDFNKYKFGFVRNLGDDFKDFRRDLQTGEIFYDDGVNNGKIVCDMRKPLAERCKIRFVNSQDSIPVDLSGEGSVAKTIKVYRNGVLEKEEPIDTALIALNSHKLKNFHNAEQAKNFIDNSYRLMSDGFEVVKNLTFDGSKTNVKIHLRNIANEQDQRDLVIYQIVSKQVASNLSELNIVDNGGAQFFVVDKDPVIGWYFNDSGSDATIEYETEGDTEGGTIVIAQEPILFNEGELVVKYRETSCNSDELTLFELDYLLDSKVYSAGSGKLFKVCLSHIDDSVQLLKNSGSRNLSILSFDNSGNASQNFDTFSEKLSLGVDDNTMYWSSIVSKENPNGNYSCIGSFTSDVVDSTFGDCGNNEDLRLWVHVGADYIAPTSVVETGPLAHVVGVEVSAVDDIAGSGVKGIYYCDDLVDSCDPKADGTYVIGDEVEFSVTCPDRWGCIRYVRIQAVDNEDNLEEINSNEVKVIDVGTSCQADCTVKPSPARYVAECNNLNSCNYYDFNNLGINDNGKYVASQCDLAIEGSYVSFNSTHDILCPNGGFREARVEEGLNVESSCDFLQIFDYPSFINGESVLLKVLVCMDQ